MRKTYSDQRKAVGRIKCGTKSNGGFKNINITNCILDHCRGFSLETVGGAHIEDIVVSNLTMRGLVHSPKFEPFCEKCSHHFPFELFGLVAWKSR